MPLAMFDFRFEKFPRNSSSALIVLVLLELASLSNGHMPKIHKFPECQWKKTQSSSDSPMQLLSPVQLLSRKVRVIRQCSCCHSEPCLHLLLDVSSFPKQKTTRSASGRLNSRFALLTVTSRSASLKRIVVKGFLNGDTRYGTAGTLSKKERRK